MKFIKRMIVLSVIVSCYLLAWRCKVLSQQESLVTKILDVNSDADLRILISPSKKLISPFSQQDQEIIERLKATLLNTFGSVGIAAPQIGFLQKIIVIIDWNVIENDDEYKKLSNELNALKQSATEDQSVIAQKKTECRERVSKLKEANMIVMINPVILNANGEQEIDDGCLSVKGVFGKTNRANEIDVAWQDQQGLSLERNFSGFAAAIVQHECDHLDGKLFFMLDSFVPNRDDMYERLAALLLRVKTIRNTINPSVLKEASRINRDIEIQKNLDTVAIRSDLT